MAPIGLRCRKKGKDRQSDHHDDPQYGREGDQGRNIVAVGIDDGCHRRNRGIAADRIPACDQQRHFGGQAKKAADQETKGDRGRYGQDNGDEKRNAGASDGGETDGRAREDDGDLKHGPGRAIYPRIEPGGWHSVDGIGSGDKYLHAPCRIGRSCIGSKAA